MKLRIAASRVIRRKLAMCAVAAALAAEGFGKGFLINCDGVTRVG